MARHSAGAPPAPSDPPALAQQRTVKSSPASQPQGDPNPQVQPPPTPGIPRPEAPGFIFITRGSTCTTLGLFPVSGLKTSPWATSHPGYRVISAGPGDLVVTRAREYNEFTNRPTSFAVATNFVFPGEKPIPSKLHVCAAGNADAQPTEPSTKGHKAASPGGATPPRRPRNQSRSAKTHAVTPRVLPSISHSSRSAGQPNTRPCRPAMSATASPRDGGFFSKKKIKTVAPVPGGCRDTFIITS